MRVGAPPAFGAFWVMPRLAPLLERHPGLAIDLSLATGSASLARREVDVALRLSRPADAGLVARRLGCLRYGLYGRRDYVDGVAPEARRFIGYGEDLADVPQQRWLRRLAGDAGIGLMASDLAAILTAVRAGMGLGAVPHVLVAPEDDLVCLAEDDEATRDLWLVVHGDLRRSPRVRAVMDHLVEITASLRDGHGAPNDREDESAS